MRDWAGSNPEKHKAGSGFGLVMAVLIGAAGVTFLASGSLRGSVAVMLWGEQEMLTCDGQLSMTLRGRTVELNDPVLDVGGLCELHVVECTLTGSTAIQVGGNARVIVEDSRLVGKRTALHVRGNAEVTLLNTELVGKRDGIDAGNNARVEMRGGSVVGERAAMSVSGSAEVKGVGAAAHGQQHTEQSGRLVGFPEPAREADEVTPEPVAEAEAAGEDAVAEPEPAPPSEPVPAPEPEEESAPETPKQRYERYAQSACDGVLECYQQNDFVGHAAGKITMKVGASGKVRTIKSKLPGASRKIGLCIKRVCKRKRIADFEGPRGTLVCTFAGTLGGGSVMISRSGEFVPRKSRRRGR